MKLYLECNMGAAGDMLTAALLGLLPDRSPFLDKMNALVPGMRVSCEPSEKCGITGLRVRVTVNGDEEISEDFSLTEPHGGDIHSGGHDHSGSGHRHAEGQARGGVRAYQDVLGIISGLDVPDQVRTDALAVYNLLSEAESEVHGVPADAIHFHEVGTMDAIADIVGFCLLVNMLAPESISASAVNVGSGFVRTDHGILPVPAPATAAILKGVPIYGSTVKGELCTPTGAALLRHFADRFGDMEPIAVSRIGYGMGAKDYEAANCVRAFLGEAQCARDYDKVTELVCNLDDMTPEAIGYTTELLLSEGALDVFSSPVFMKKNRPAVMLTCLSRLEDADRLSRLMLFNTTTFGVRRRECSRDILSRSSREVETPYGPIRVKYAQDADIRKAKPEYEDVRAAAKKYGVPYDEVSREAMASLGRSPDRMP